MDMLDSFKTAGGRVTKRALEGAGKATATVRSKAKKKSSDEYLVALDIGTEFVKALIGKIGEDDMVSDDERRLLAELITPFGVPTLFLPTFGHGFADNEIWPLGSLVQLDATAASITFLEPLVAAT